MMKRISPLFMLVLMLLLAACGQKGPLYLPDEQAGTTQAAGDGQRD